MHTDEDEGGLTMDDALALLPILCNLSSLKFLDVSPNNLPLPDAVDDLNADHELPRRLPSVHVRVY